VNPDCCLILGWGCGERKWGPHSLRLAGVWGGDRQPHPKSADVALATCAGHLGVRSKTLRFPVSVCLSVCLSVAWIYSSLSGSFPVLPGHGAPGCSLVWGQALESRAQSPGGTWKTKRLPECALSPSSGGGVLSAAGCM
jgi:hypothetical protein